MFSFRKLYFAVLLGIAALNAEAQRLNTGVSIDFYSFNPTRFPSDLIFSETNYKAYFIETMQSPRDLQLGNYSLNLNAEYGRYFINTRFGLNSTLNGLIYKMSYPIGGKQFTDYYSRIQFQKTELALSFGYILNPQKYLKPYFEAGFGKSMPYFYREDFSTDKTFSKLWSGQEEIKELLSLHESYNFLMLSAGYRADFFSCYVRYTTRLGDYPVHFSSLTFGIAAYTRFSKLRKHYIYQPDE